MVLAITSIAHNRGLGGNLDPSIFQEAGRQSILANWHTVVGFHDLGPWDCVRI